MTAAIASTSDLVRSTSKLVPASEIQVEVLHHLDTEFSDLDTLLGRDTGAGPSKRGKKRRTLSGEIAQWEKLKSQASSELERTSKELPILLESTQARLQTFLSTAQTLSLKRYDLADRLTRLVNDLSEDAPPLDGKKGKTVLTQLESLGDELGRLEASLAWVGVVERVVLLSEATVNPSNHRPSPLAALSHYEILHGIVVDMQRKLPGGMIILTVLQEVRDRTWDRLKEIMSKNLLTACEAIKWPLKVDYPSLGGRERRDFERACEDLLYLQSAGEKLHGLSEKPVAWASGTGLYPLQAMIQPISLRFKYHFQGSRNTNRVDKPEWAFANILDQIYDHQGFISDYLQPLTSKAGYNISIKSEFTLLLFPILLAFLKTRIPHILPHPALLAHTIYQTILFDESVQEGGFDLGQTSIYEGRECGEWEGLAGLVLKQEGWFDQWVNGERTFAEHQMNDIISWSDAWTISEDLTDEEITSSGLRPTVSARQVKGLIEQLTDRYTPLPSIEHKLPFLITIQLPLLMSYHSRISTSLDAFETFSSAFVRAVPGALSGNTRGGVHMDQSRLTGGVEGLGRLVKAVLSAGWVLQAMREWSDDIFFIGMSDELAKSPSIRWRLQSEPLLHNPSPDSEGGGMSVWDIVSEKYTALVQRAEEMIVRLISVEVENDLKKHLQRRWDQTSLSGDEIADPSLVNALTTLSSNLSHLAGTLPQLSTIRLYRQIVHHISNHIAQRGVYSGWSKFTQFGGKAFQSEVEDYIHASTQALTSTPTSSTGSQDHQYGIPPAIIESPWIDLKAMGKVLALPNDTDEDTKGVTFAQAMAAAWSDGESLDVFYERMGIELDRALLHAVLRRRVECWR